jgi:hypothetical protein
LVFSGVKFLARVGSSKEGDGIEFALVLYKGGHELSDQDKDMLSKPPCGINGQMMIVLLTQPAFSTLPRSGGLSEKVRAPREGVE